MWSSSTEQIRFRRCKRTAVRGSAGHGCHPVCILGQALRCSGKQVRDGLLRLLDVDGLCNGGPIDIREGGRIMGTGTITEIIQ